MARIFCYDSRGATDLTLRQAFPPSNEPTRAMNTELLHHLLRGNDLSRRAMKILFLGMTLLGGRPGKSQQAGA